MIAQHIQYVLRTNVRIPETGPHVAIQEETMEPTKAPKTAQRAESRKLRPYTAGPNIPRVMLLGARLIEIQSKKTCSNSLDTTRFQVILDELVLESSNNGAQS